MKGYHKTIKSEKEKIDIARSDFWEKIRIEMGSLPSTSLETFWTDDAPGKVCGQAYEFDTGYVRITSTSSIYDLEHFKDEEADKTGYVLFEAKLYGLGIRSDSEFGKKVQEVFEKELGFEPQN